MAVNISGGGPLDWEVGFDFTKARAQVKEFNSTIDQIGKKVKDQASDMDQFANKAAKAIATYVSVNALSGFVQSIVKVRGEFQQLEVAFETILKSKEKADSLMAQIVDLAAKTPFGLEEAARGAKQLLAYGTQAEKVSDTLKTLGNIAAGVGAPLNDLVYLYGTLQTQGRAYQRDIIQFTSRGIPLIDELAKQFGVSKDKVQELVEAGKVGFPQIEKAFKSLTSEGGIFNNLMEKQSQTITGLISNFGDAWETMLNDIGKSQEGPIADIIKGSISVVENYQKVLDIIKVLVVTYGGYRAAVIATAAAQTIAANAAKGWTIAETLRYRAMVLSEKAMKLLNATMLTNPYVAATTAIVGLISVLSLLGKQATLVKSKQELLKQASEGVSSSLVEQQAKLSPLMEAIRQGNLTDQQRIKIYNQLKEINPKIVDGLTAQTISYEALRKNVNAYLDVLREQIALESNTEAIKESITNENAINKQIANQKRSIENLKKLYGTDSGSAINSGNALVGGVAIENAKKYLSQLEDSLKQQQEVTKQLGQEGADAIKKTDAQVEQQKKRTLQVIDEEIEALKKKQSEESDTSAAYKAFQAKIDLLKKERDAIAGNTKEIQKQEDKYDSIIQKRAQALQDINDLESGARQSGLISTQKEIDVINEKYNKQLQSVKDVNAEIEKYNNRNPGKKVSLLGDAETSRIEASRQVEIANVSYRQDAENYIKSLDDKRAAFDKLTEAQQSGSTEAVEFTRQQYQEQVGQFDSYVDYLKEQIGLLSSDVLSGNANLADVIKFNGLQDELEKALQQTRETQRQESIKEFDELIRLSKTYDGKRSDIEKKYSNLYAALEKQRTQITQKEYDERKKNLDKEKENDLSQIGEDILQKSDAWKKFQEGFDDIGVKATLSVIKGLKDLRNEVGLTADQIKVIDKAIKESEKSLFQKSTEPLKVVAELISSLGNDLNIQLSKTFKITAQQISSIISNVQTLFDKSSSKSSQVGSLVGLISTVVLGIRDALLSAEDLADPLQDQHDAYAAIGNQIEANNLLLEQQLKIMDELSGAAKLQAQVKYLGDLKSQQDAALKSLKEFQIEYIKSSKEVYVDPLGIDNNVSTAGINALADLFLWGGQAKRKIKYELEAVDTSGFKTIEDFTKLLAEIKENGGKINGKTVLEDDIKGLEEYINNYNDLVEKQKQLKDQLDQIFTGTTADSIADGIIEGLKAGKHGAEDFADNFQDLMKGAILNSIKYQTLEEPLKAFYDQFSQFSASDGGILTPEEIQKLKDVYSDIVQKADQQFENLQKITSIDLTGGSDSANSLTGAIKGMTEQQAELLAGQFGGLRMTALDHLNVAKANLDAVQKIENNTFQLFQIRDTLKRFEINGIKVI